jgi:hypothetical protein
MTTPVPDRGAQVREADRVSRVEVAGEALDADPRDLALQLHRRGWKDLTHRAILLAAWCAHKSSLSTDAGTRIPLPARPISMTGIPRSAAPPHGGAVRSMTG